MDRALKDVFIPSLRERGFTGSYPHFRRRGAERIDYLSIQFSQSGGKFCVEIARSGPDGVTTGSFRDRPIAKLNVTYFHNRHRLGSNPPAGQSDHWYVFAPPSYGGATQGLSADEIARMVLADYDAQADAWLEDETVRPPAGRPPSAIG
jgi:hypothetical protein